MRGRILGSAMAISFGLSASAQIAPGELSATDALHAQSNTDPDPKTDLRLALRAALIGTVFPRYAK